MDIQVGNMQEGYHEVLEECMQFLIDKVTDKFKEDLDTKASMLIHVADSCFCTVMHWCVPEDRSKLVKVLADRLMEHIVEYQQLANDG